MLDCPTLNPEAPIQFLINAAAGSSAADTKREVIESVLQAQGRQGDLYFCSPTELAHVSREAAQRALSTGAAVVAVGGDGTLNTVAQAAHTVGCAMGVVPQGTFNYFARTAFLLTRARRFACYCTPSLRRCRWLASTTACS